jgi:O-methyltransferase
MARPITAEQATRRYLDLLKHALANTLYEESTWRQLTPTKAWRKSLLKLLDAYGYKIVSAPKYDHDRRLNGLDHPGIGYTMIGLKRLDNIEQLLRIIAREKVPGDILEAGVWRGGAAIFAQGCLKALGEDRTLWLADSFQAMPRPVLPQDEGWDMSQAFHLVAGSDYVRSNFEKFDLWSDNVRFLEGWFSETLGKAPVQKIALLRMDGDLYKSTMDILTNLYDKVVTGGFLIVDDYFTWIPCRKAVHDFFDARNEKISPIAIDGDGVYWRKT